jgi:hypothetical protein
VDDGGGSDAWGDAWGEGPGGAIDDLRGDTASAGGDAFESSVGTGESPVVDCGI